MTHPSELRTALAQAIRHYEKTRGEITDFRVNDIVTLRDYLKKTDWNDAELAHQFLNYLNHTLKTGWIMFGWVLFSTGKSNLKTLLYRALEKNIHRLKPEDIELIIDFLELNSKATYQRMVTVLQKEHEEQQLQFQLQKHQWEEELEQLHRELRQKESPQSVPPELAERLDTYTRSREAFLQRLHEHLSQSPITAPEGAKNTFPPSDIEMGRSPSHGMNTTS